MKISLDIRRKGYALLLVMMIIGLTILVAASTLKRTYSVSMLNQRAKQLQGSVMASEAAAEKVYARVLYDYTIGGLAAVSNNLSIYRTNVPTSAESSYWANYQFSNGQGVNGQTYVNMTALNVWQVLNGLYAGLNGWQTTYRVVANARPLTGAYPVDAGIQQEIAMQTIPAFQFAIFYNGLLEFTACAPLNVNGKTHANGPIHLGPGSGSSLKFNGTVTTTDTISWVDKSIYSFSGSTGKGTVTYGASNVVGVAPLSLPIGSDSTPTAVRQIVELPTGSDSASLSEQRYYNKAGVVMLISNQSVKLILKDQGGLAGTTYADLVYSNATPTTAQQSNLNYILPFVSLTNRFYDYREQKWVMPTQIDIGRYKNWAATNTTVLGRFNPASGIYPTIMYVADFRTLTNLHAVRLTNGVVIPTNGTTTVRGFTLATRNPLYVWGDYNCPNPSALGTSNTSQTFPASLVADAVTVLSGSWQDSTYGSNLSPYNSRANRVADDVTVNAAIIAGNVITTTGADGYWSGGVHNLPRLLEKWSSSDLTLNTSLVNLFPSVMATNRFIDPSSTAFSSSSYYYAPSHRNFWFNTNYLREVGLPPGTPTVSIMSRSAWRAIPAGTVTYSGP